MRVNHEALTTALGPGRRYVIWTQGCTKRCSGCINPAGWSLHGGYTRSLHELKEKLRSLDSISGVTISGGEPFLQFEELDELVRFIAHETPLDVMIYTGWLIEELQAKFGGRFDRFVENVDILIDGDYQEQLDTGSALRGSDNQRIFCFTDKYRDARAAMMRAKGRTVSFEIASDGEIYIIGVPPAHFYAQLLKQLEEDQRI